MSVFKRGDKWIARPYLDGKHVHLGTFDTEAQAWRAHERARAEQPIRASLTCDGFAEQWLRDYPRPKASTRKRNADAISGFATDFKGCKLTGPFSRAPWARRKGRSRSPDRVIARAWAMENRHRLPAVRAMYNDALNDGLVSVNHFAALGLEGSRGRKDIIPPTSEEVEALAETAREVANEGFAAMILFAAYTGVRPGELWELRWDDLDLARDEITVSRRIYKGEVAPPKNGRTRTIILPPPARAALTAAPRRMDTELLFTTPTGKQWQAPSMSYWWKAVRAAAGRPAMDFYELRHFCATHLLERELTPSDVAVQLGHTDGGRLVQELYGHPSEDGARRRLKAAFQPVPELQKVRTQRRKSA